MPSPDSALRFALRRDGNRILVEATCPNCGITDFLWSGDGSLREWKSRHKDHRILRRGAATLFLVRPRAATARPSPESSPQE